MYINPKHIILAMGIMIVLMMMYIIHLLRHPVGNSQQPIIIMPGNGNQFSGNQAQHIQDQNRIANTNFAGGLQSDFFKRSLQFATDYLQGRSSSPVDTNSLPMDSQQILSCLAMLSESVKRNIVIAINYFSIDVANAADTENKFRTISSETKTPLWIVILREGASKVIPNFNLMNDNNFNPNFIAPNNLMVVKNIS